MDYQKANTTPSTTLNFASNIAPDATPGPLDANEIDRLNLDTNEMSWSTPDRDPRNIGNKATFAPEQTEQAEQAGQPAINSDQSPELGQIIPAMPPGYTEEPAVPAPPATISYARNNAMHGDRLKTEVINDIQDHERKLSADGNIAAFVDYYDTISAEFQGKEL